MEIVMFLCYFYQFYHMFQSGTGFRKMGSKAINLVLETIRRFLTDIEQFDKSYMSNDHFQKRENAKQIPHFAQVIKAKFEKDKKPITILDFCCGHGIPTFQLLQKLLELGVQVEKVIGYDVSEQNIGFAQKNNPLPDLIQFQLKNLETQFAEVEKYDVVVALFGLHWMNDSDKAIENISRCLKPGGLFLAITPLENQELFSMREKFISTPRWEQEFTNGQFELHRFHGSADDYMKPLSKYFNCTRNQVKEDFYEYSTGKFITFFESWFQEVRHLIHEENTPLKKQILAKSFIAEFIYEIPEGFKGKYMTKKSGKYTYAHPLHFFQGTKTPKK